MRFAAAVSSSYEGDIKPRKSRNEKGKLVIFLEKEETATKKKSTHHALMV